MFGPIIGQLLDGKLTTVGELEEITGRSTSTVYRWINDESQPLYQDMQRILRRLSNPEARQTLVDLLTSDLPVIVSWIDSDGQSVADDTGDDDAGRDAKEVVAQSLLALHCLTDLLSEQHAAIHEQTLSPETGERLVRLLTETMRHLTVSRGLIERHLQRRSSSGDGG